MLRKISYRAQQLVTHSLGSCQVLPPRPEQIKVPYARGKVFIPECWMGPRRAGTWCNSTINFNGAALWAWPCKEGSTSTGTIHKQLSKKPGSTKKARNSSYCLCYTSLPPVKWSKTLCLQLPGLTPPPDPPSSGISSGSDEPNHPPHTSRAPSRFPDCSLLWADYNSRFGTAVSSVSYSRTPILRPFCCSVIASPSRVHRKKCLCNENTAEELECPSNGKLDSSPTSLPVDTAEGKDNLPGVMS